MRALAALAIVLAATPASAKSWTVDYTKSELTFSGAQANQPFTGKFSEFTADIDFDPAKPELGKLNVTIPMASASIAGDKEQNAALPTEDWFFTEKFPSAVFESIRIASAGRDTNTYSAEGNLTLRGVTKPVTIAFTLQPEGDATRAIGTSALTRTDFGLGGKQWADDRWIAYPVTVKFSLLAR